MMKSFVLNRESFWIETCFESGQKCFWILKRKKTFWIANRKNKNKKIDFESNRCPKNRNRIVGHQKIHSPNQHMYTRLLCKERNSECVTFNHTVQQGPKKCTFHICIAHCKGRFKFVPSLIFVFLDIATYSTMTLWFWISGPWEGEGIPGG